MTLASRLHWAFGAVVFSLIPISCFTFWWTLRRNRHWRTMAAAAFATGIVTLLAVILMSAGPAAPPAPPNGWNAVVGLVQRAVIIPFFIWIGMLALFVL